MNAEQWEIIIRQECQNIGTYREPFEPVIKTLAGIMEIRDRAKEAYQESGAEPCVIRVSDRGSKNLTKNPLLALQMELDTQALQYWRDLGLTPAGYRKITNRSITDGGRARNTLELMIEALEREMEEEPSDGQEMAQD